MHRHGLTDRFPALPNRHRIVKGIVVVLFVGRCNAVVRTRCRHHPWRCRPSAHRPKYGVVFERYCGERSRGIVTWQGCLRDRRSPAQIGPVSVGTFPLHIVTAAADGQFIARMQLTFIDSHPIDANPVGATQIPHHQVLAHLRNAAMHSRDLAGIDLNIALGMPADKEDGLIQKNTGSFRQCYKLSRHNIAQRDATTITTTGANASYGIAQFRPLQQSSLVKTRSPFHVLRWHNRCKPVREPWFSLLWGAAFRGRPISVHLGG